MPQRRIKTVNYTETLLTICTRNESIETVNWQVQKIWITEKLLLVTKF